MPWVGFEPTISAVERPKTYALDRTATETGVTTQLQLINISYHIKEQELLEQQLCFLRCFMNCLNSLDKPRGNSLKQTLTPPTMTVDSHVSLAHCN